MAGIQDRMPVIIERSDWPVWLGEADGDATRLLRAAPDDVLRTWQVDKKVGNVRNDGPELIKPVAELEPTLLSRSGQHRPGSDFVSMRFRISVFPKIATPTRIRARSVPSGS